jgi:hypothetical protein
MVNPDFAQVAGSALKLLHLKFGSNTGGNLTRKTIAPKPTGN